MIQYLVPAARSAGIQEYLASWGQALAGRMRVLSYEDLPGRNRLEPATYIFSALDQVGPAMRRYAVELHRQIGGRPGYRTLNHPTQTLHRLELLTELHRRGLNSFRAVRAGDDLTGIRYPAFLRTEREHDGAISALLRSRPEIEDAIGRALLSGRRLNDLLVVEFCPTADGDGWYRKYAAYVVGDRIVPRHMVTGREWMLKIGSAEITPERIAEEFRYLEDNPHRERLAEIFRSAAVDYGRIDYAVSEGRIETWEINLNPVIGYAVPSPNRQRQNDLFYPRFQSALEALEVTREGEAFATAVIDGGMVRAARNERFRPARSRETLARLVSPARPILEPLLRPAFPLIGRLARRRALRS